MCDTYNDPGGWKKNLNKKFGGFFFFFIVQDGDYACAHFWDVLCKHLTFCCLNFTATAAHWTESFLSCKCPPAEVDSFVVSLFFFLSMSQGPQTISQQASAGRRTTQTRAQTQTPGATVQSFVRLRCSGHRRAQLQRWRPHRHYQRG